MVKTAPYGPLRAVFFIYISLICICPENTHCVNIHVVLQYTQ